MKILVIGAGFAGISAVQKLERGLKKNKNVQIMLFDKNPYTTMVPTLPDYTGEAVDEEMNRAKITKIIPDNVEFIKEEITQIDADKSTVYSVSQSYEYDYLIIGSGSVINYFGFDKNLDKLYPLTTFDHANKILKDYLKILRKTPQPNLVIVGAGYTGIELASHLSQTAKNHYKKIQITLIEKNKDILPFLSEKQKKYVKKYLESNYFRLLTNTSIDDFDGRNITLSSGETLQDCFVCWSTGTKFSIGNIVGNFEKIADGRIKVNEYLQTTNYSNIYTIGDCAAIDQDGIILRKAVNFSIYSGEHAGINIAKSINNKALKKFKPLDLGWILPLGRTSIGLIFNKIEIKGELGMRLHYLMSGYRSYNNKNRLKFYRLALTGMRYGKMKKEIKTISKGIFKENHSIEKYAYLALRILFGASFIYHGINKLWMGLDNVTEMFGLMGIPAAQFFAPFVTFTELFAGMLLVVGLFTRFSSLAIMTIMFVATFMVHAGVPYGNPLKQISIVYFFIGLLYFFGGGGEFSVDNLLYRNIKHRMKEGKIHI